MSTPDVEHTRGAVVFFYGVLGAALAAFVYMLSSFAADVVRHGRPGIRTRGVCVRVAFGCEASLKQKKLRLLTIQLA